MQKSLQNLHLLNLLLNTQNSMSEVVASVARNFKEGSKKGRGIGLNLCVVADSFFPEF